MFHSQWLVGWLEARMLWFFGSIAVVKCAGLFPGPVPKAEEAVSPAEESIDLVEFNLALPGRIEKGSLSFLMGLRPEFNNLRSSIQHRVLTPDIDRAVADVRSEETQLPSLSVSVYEELRS
ncbi:hypothetical protein Salat_2978200 [Sesamum alatum]|uniref:Uncharacterized protein n=1 Tax=Sesamum alatum TaxID=300844 RepID=A0AAE2C7L4_9LAMI|nr:hypothetical protein Salat_2978200 [Sesamum alatum]